MGLDLAIQCKSMVLAGKGYGGVVVVVGFWLFFFFFLVIVGGVKT